MFRQQPRGSQTVPKSSLRGVGALGILRWPLEEGMAMIESGNICPSDGAGRSLADHGWARSNKETWI